MEFIGKVGSKGELFPPKKLRDTLGLKNDQKVLYKIRHGKLVVEPIFSPEELLKREPTVEISDDEFREFRLSLSKRLEQ